MQYLLTQGELDALRNDEEAFDRRVKEAVEKEIEARVERAGKEIVRGLEGMGFREERFMADPTLVRVAKLFREMAEGLRRSSE